MDELTEAEREALWEVIATVRDAAPRVPDDADTDDIIDAIIDSGLFHRVHAAGVAEGRAEVAARVEALADEWERYAAASRREIPSHVAPNHWAAEAEKHAAALHAALAGTSPQGEASVEARDPADYGYSDLPRVGGIRVIPNDGPERARCRVCGHLAIDHTRGRYSVYGVCPTPHDYRDDATAIGDGI